MVANLFHACMDQIMKPLEKAGMVGIKMSSGDGMVRQTHPILTNYVGDYPEQTAVTSVKSGECPTCDITHNELGNIEASQLCDLEAILDALDTVDDDDPTTFTHACQDARIKPIVHPFWQNLPCTNIYHSITPDVLHRLHQGIIKHLFAWVIGVFGAAKIDARCHHLPPNHNIQLFMKGISSLSHVMGQQHSQMCRFLLGLILDIHLPNSASPSCLLQAIHALLDFLYLAQCPCHSTKTLQLLDDTLLKFHENKDIFIDMGIREHFKIPKLHLLCHYVMYIKLFWSTDNYNTQYTEHLHIDLTKDAYHATNHRDKYLQMTLVRMKGKGLSP